MPQLVLVNPQIPPNTGNIARTCAATRTQLHLVGPLGFEITDRYLKRAGLDYWPYVNLKIHPSIDAFIEFRCQHPGRSVGFSVRGTCSHFDFQFLPDDWILFVTLGRLTSEQYLQAGAAGIVVIEGAGEIARLAALHDLPPFAAPATLH